MFKKFESTENVSSVNNAKSSVQRGVRNSVLDQYPYIKDYIDQIVPKKDNIKVVKCHEHIELLANSSGDVLFFKQREGPYIPSLKLLHKYPFILPPMKVDRGAIRFVLSGANIMCPGLTSAGGKLSEVDKDTVVAVMAEDKIHAVAIGLTKMSSEEMLTKNKGIGVDNLHYLNDGLWCMKPVK